MPTHASNLSVLQLVLNRLTFVVNSPTITALVSNFTYEAMTIIEPCLQISTHDYISNAPNVTLITYNGARVGDEQYYTFAMKMILADIVAAILLNQESVSSTFSSTSTNAIKKAKAGSVEVEFGTNVTRIVPTELINGFIKSAAQKLAKQFGCALEYCDGCITAQLVSAVYLGFRVVKDKPFKC